MCENRRMMEISNDFNNRPLVFIRFNPDEYICEKTNTKVTSCWTNNTSTGKYEIKKTKVKEWNNRLSTLETTINEIIDNYNSNDNNDFKMIDVKYLFYN